MTIARIQEIDGFLKENDDWNAVYGKRVEEIAREQQELKKQFDVLDRHSVVPVSWRHCGSRSFSSAMNMFLP